MKILIIILLVLFIYAAIWALISSAKDDFEDRERYHKTMTKYDVGKLKRGDRVVVDSKMGTVVSPHEPEWIDHKTRAFRKEFQGADIQFDGELHSTYIHADRIELPQ